MAATRDRVMVPLIHFGGGVTDCGREVDDLPDGELTTSTRALVTCGECVDAYDHLRRYLRPGPAVDALEQLGALALRRCRSCGCTDLNCNGCIVRTGLPCSWVEPDLCSACVIS